MGQLLQFPQEGSDRNKRIRSELSAAPKKLKERTLAEWAQSWKLHLEDNVSSREPRP